MGLARAPMMEENMADAIIILLVAFYCAFVIGRIFRKKKPGAAGCSGSCIGCSGCSAEHIDALIRKAAEAKERR